MIIRKLIKHCLVSFNFSSEFVALKGGKGSLISGKRRALPLSHEVQSRLPCILNPLSEESLGAAGSTPSPRLGQRFMSKGLSV